MGQLCYRLLQTWTSGSSVGVVELEEDKSVYEYCQDTGEIQEQLLDSVGRR